MVGWIPSLSWWLVWSETDNQAFSPSPFLRDLHPLLVLSTDQPLHTIWAYIARLVRLWWIMVVGSPRLIFGIIPHRTSGLARLLWAWPPSPTMWKLPLASLVILSSISPQSPSISHHDRRSQSLPPCMTVAHRRFTALSPIGRSIRKISYSPAHD